MPLELVNQLPYNHPYRWDGTLFGGPKLWRPTEITTALWLDAEDTSTITLNGATVSQWADKSGSGRNATQATAANQPAYNAALLGGKPALTFDGVNDLMSIASRFLDSTNRIIIAVAKENSGGFGGIITSKLAATDTAVAIDINNSRTYEYFYGSTTGFLASGSGANWSIVAGQSDTNIHTISMNGSVVNSNTLAVSPTNTASTTEIGPYRVGELSNIGAFDLSELVVTTTNTQTADRQKLEGYLAWKWGLQANLPVGHPYKNTPPTV